MSKLRHRGIKEVTNKRTRCFMVIVFMQSKICRNGTVHRLLVKKAQCQLHLLEKKIRYDTLIYQAKSVFFYLLACI